MNVSFKKVVFSLKQKVGMHSAHSLSSDWESWTLESKHRRKQYRVRADEGLITQKNAMT